MDVRSFLGTVFWATGYSVCLVFALNLLSSTSSNIRVEASYQSIRERQYGKWPTPNNITYMFEASFPNDTRSIVTKAADALSAIGSGNCIKFNLVSAEPTDGKPFIIVTNRTKPNYRGQNVTATVCDSNPGRWRLTNTTRNYLTVITSNATGFHECSTDQRVIMGLFFRTLGFFSELQRPDRGNRVDFKPENLVAGLTETETVVYDRLGDDGGSNRPGDLVTDFDLDSITIPPSLYLSKSRTDRTMEVFTGKDDNVIGNGNNALPSRSDCVSVSKLYKRENAGCTLDSCGT